MRPKKRTIKQSASPQRLWWVFKLKSGEIQKKPGTELRELEDSYEVWDEHVHQLSVLKDKIADRWAQDTENHPRENLKSMTSKTGHTKVVPHMPATRSTFR